MSFRKINLFLYLLVFLIPSQVFFSNNIFFSIPLLLVNIFILIIVFFLVKWIIFRNEQKLFFFFKRNLFGIGLLMWLIGGGISFLVNSFNMPSEIFLTYPFSILIFFFVFSIFYSVNLKNVKLVRLILCLLIGSSLSLLNGVYTYYGIYGIPDPATLLTARFDLEKFEPYKDATFGNSGATATFLSLIVPTLFSFHKIPGFKITHKSLIYFLYFICIINVLIVSSRTLFFVIFLLMFMLIFKSSNLIKLFLWILAIIVAASLLTINEDIYEYFSLVKEFVQSATEFEDNSSYERYDAVVEGWDLFMSNFLFGIGPGMSLKIHSQTSSHQFHVNQALETGIIGLLGTLLLSVAIFKNFLESFLYKENGIKTFFISGSCSYIIYLILANGSLSNSYNWVWIGMFAILTGLYFNLKSTNEANYKKS